MKKYLLLAVSLCALCAVAFNVSSRLQAQQASADAGGYRIDGGGIGIILQNGNVTYGAGVNVLSPSLANATLTGTVVLPGNATLTGNAGNVTLGANISLTISNGSETLTNGSLTLTNGSLTLSAGNITTPANGSVNGFVSIVTANILGNSTNTTLYTPPAGVNFAVSAVEIECVNITTLTTAAVLHCAAGSTTNNVTANLTMTSAATGQYFNDALATQPFLCNSTAPLTLNISTSGAAANYTIRARIQGTQY